MNAEIRSFTAVENGEFHTFVFDTPVFGSAIPVQTGEVVERDGFVFADVVHATN